LLTALAGSAREGRTLVLIDEPERLARRIALLTFAFPEALRPALTFSTYHDRPEELAGFCLQGTVPAARPNPSALIALGAVADAATGRVEPRVEPSRWAATLAGWFLRREKEDEAAWNRANELARQVREDIPSRTLWSDDWLDGLFA